MTALTPEIKHAIEQAGDELVLLEDPQTRKTYVLLKSDDYGRRSRRRLTFLRHESLSPNCKSVLSRNR